MADGGDHFGDAGAGIFAERELVVVEEEFELVGEIGAGKIETLVAEEVFFHLGKFLLGGIDLGEDEGDLLGDEGDVLVGVVEEAVRLLVFWGGGEGVESEEVGGDDGEEHEKVDGGGAECCSPESGGSVANLERN